MSQPNASSSAAYTERLLSADARRVFEAIENPDQCSRWWGPAGFTNTFEQFEFKPGGRWVFVMHGPNGVNYPNECVFLEVEPTKVVIEHVVPPWFKLTITLTPRGEQTHLTWNQEFESPEVASKLLPIVGPANEQNLDRLEALLAG